MKIGKGAGRSFHTLNQRCHNDRNHKPLYNNGLLYFIEVHGMRKKAGTSQKQGKWHLGRESIY